MQPQPISIERLLEANPGVDATQVQEVRKALAVLRDQGVVHPQRYEISSPYERRALHCDER